MKETLYLLRRQPEQISPALFVASDTEKDVVFTEHVTSVTPSSLEEKIIMKPENTVVKDSSHTLTYDELVEKIFSSMKVIVI